MGFFASARVSAGALCLAEGPVCAFVSASKISVPGSSGDRFGDWVVALQFEPSQTALFSRDANAKSHAPLSRIDSGDWTGRSLQALVSSQEQLAGRHPSCEQETIDQVRARIGLDLMSRKTFAQPTPSEDRSEPSSSRCRVV